MSASRVVVATLLPGVPVRRDATPSLCIGGPVSCDRPAVVRLHFAGEDWTGALSCNLYPHIDRAAVRLVDGYRPDG